jgi:hypothetical protein
MKNLREYLAESQRTYNYRISICGEMPSDFIDRLKEKLKQFDIAKITEPRETPIMPRSTSFPKYPNEKVTMFDCQFRYPAIESQTKNFAQSLGLDPNRIVMLTSAHCDGIVDELERTDEENKGLLVDTDYPDNTPEQKELIKDYSAPYGEHEVLKNTYRSDFEIAGGTTPPAKTTNDFKMGDDSPFTKVKRPAKPKTGRNP